MSQHVDAGRRQPVAELDVVYGDPEAALCADAADLVAVAGAEAAADAGDGADPAVGRSVALYCAVAGRALIRVDVEMPPFGE